MCLQTWDFLLIRVQAVRPTPSTTTMINPGSLGRSLSNSDVFVRTRILATKNLPFDDYLTQTHVVALLLWLGSDIYPKVPRGRPVQLSSLTLKGGGVGLSIAHPSNKHVTPVINTW